MFESVVSESDASIVVPVEFSVTLRMSEMDMFESVVRKYEMLEDVVFPVNFDSVTL